jgi:ADP-dependent NAD(P)H-hydrate dehydratase
VSGEALPAGVSEIDAAALRARPLPAIGEGGKVERGSVLVVGGSREVPGAVLLAGLGALRAGAGRLQVATVASRVAALGFALPEAMVMELPETPLGGFDDGAFGHIEAHCARSDAVLIGPGTREEPEGYQLVAAVVQSAAEPALVIDAGGLGELRGLRKELAARKGRVVITPHAGEMAGMLGERRESVEADPLGAARRMADELNVVVVMKGARTFVAAPGGTARLYRGGGVGLGTSGSGDVLAGVIAGLLARGAEPLEAAARGVFLHGEAGARLARTLGTVGFLAREILDAIPPVMEKLDRDQAALSDCDG